MTDGKPANNEGSNVTFAGPVTNGPDSYGFDYYYGHCGSLDMAPYVYVENGKATAQPDRVTENTEKFTWWRKGPTASDFQHEDVLPNFTRRSVKYIEERAETGEPFIIRWPGQIPAATVCDQPIGTVDLYPTFLDLAGIEPDPKQHLDGVSIAPLLRGDAEQLQSRAH
jgi:hypothetical protein